MDLSENNLGEVIPEEIGALRQLINLNLSGNHLVGMIPEKIGFHLRTQLDTLDDPSIYKGNAYLCSPPIGKNCSGDQAAPPSTSNHMNGSEMIWFYLGMALGFVFGFFIVYGILLFHITWRNTYFQIMDNLFDTVSMGVAVTVNSLNKK
ncbi:receptor-like protein EIX2 [Typha angustifolia]|uniref:receptor-like protein EIX2 n=1 Tax=Typha angustifolia TaxID=59011 RepID=UPI003C2F5BFB